MSDLVPVLPPEQQTCVMLTSKVSWPSQKGLAQDSKWLHLCGGKELGECWCESEIILLIVCI